jgi:hypothetical protein
MRNLHHPFQSLYLFSVTFFLCLGTILNTVEVSSPDNSLLIGKPRKVNIQHGSEPVLGTPTVELITDNTVPCSTRNEALLLENFLDCHISVNINVTTTTGIILAQNINIILAPGAQANINYPITSLNFGQSYSVIANFNIKYICDTPNTPNNVFSLNETYAIWRCNK